MTQPPVVFVNTVKKETAFTFVIFLLKIVFTSVCGGCGGRKTALESVFSAFICGFWTSS